MWKVKLPLGLSITPVRSYRRHGDEAQSTGTVEVSGHLHSPAVLTPGKMGSYGYRRASLDFVKGKGKVVPLLK
jgi:hypothetical protein